MTRDDRLTALLTRSVETLEPSADLWQRTRLAVRRARVRRAAGVVLAAALVAAAVPALDWPGRDGGVAFEPAPAGDTWGSMAATSLAPGSTMTWAGDRLVMLGEQGGARFLPPEQRWEPLPAAPIAPRRGHTAVWTGEALVVWGGTTSDDRFADGAAFDPDRGAWEALPASPLSARWGHSAVWTGSEMIVWGGLGDNGTAFTDGAAYDPATRTWRVLATGPLTGRTAHTAVWTGTEMIVWGGEPYGPEVSPDWVDHVPGAAYDPASDSWRTLADAPPLGLTGGAVAWTGDRMVVWGGTANRDGQVWETNTGAAYDPEADAWTALPPSPLGPRHGVASVWTGNALLVWGGSSGRQATHDDGALYEPSRGVWVAAATSPLEGRAGATAVWDGERVRLCGGTVVQTQDRPGECAAYAPAPEGQGEPAPAAREVSAPPPAPPPLSGPRRPLGTGRGRAGGDARRWRALRRR